MQTFNLGYDEYVLLETEDAFWVNRDGLSINNFVLTNKRILCDYEMSNGLFKKSAQEFCEYYLTDILATNGEALVCQTKFESYWCIQIHFRQGTEYFSFSESPKKIIPQWVNGIIDAIAKLDNKQQKEEKQSEEYTEGTFFCSDCGTRLEIGAKFCKNCGKSVIQEEPVNKPDESKPEESTERETVYEGKIHKCPNCGETVDSFEAVCKSCGYELRNKKPVISVTEFVKLYSEAVDNNKKIDLIKTFSIPNSKEDILEFVILAASNIESDNDSAQNVSEAWMVKLEQAYQKATFALKGEPELEKIEKIYRQKNACISDSKTKKKKIKFYLILLSICCILLGVFISAISGNSEILLITYIGFIIGALLLLIKH